MTPSAPQKGARPAQSTRRGTQPPAWPGPEPRAGSTAPTRSRKGGGGGKKGSKRKKRRPLWATILLWLTGFFLVSGILGALGFLWAYNTLELPDPDKYAGAQTTTVYYADGTTELGRLSEYNRTIVDFSTLPAYVGNAVVASEDQGFWTNPGVDIKATVRALWNNLKGGARQGGSTLTQQYIERYYQGDTFSYVGKAKEAILALKVTREQPKEVILGNYLNTIYFGRGAYGIEAAAQAYFGVAAAKLTLSQAVLLAGVIPAPSDYDPRVDPEIAQKRFDRVLNFMQAGNFISAEEAAQAKMPETIEPKTTEYFAGPGGYLLEEVRFELTTKGGLTKDQIATGGFKIITTFDPAMQAKAVEAVQELPEDKPANLGVAIMSVEPGTGEVKAMYGGADYLKVQRNAATDDRVQAGSTFKPFTLIGALENDVKLTDYFDGNSPYNLEGTDLWFANFGEVSYGPVNLIDATADSVNTAFIEVNKKIGPAVTRQVAVRAGIPADAPGLDDNVGNTLGSASVTTADLATAYNTFASGGMRYETHMVRSVTNPTGEVIYTGPVNGQRQFSAENAASLTYAMEQVVKKGSAETALELERPVAGKTGSSSDNKSALFAGYIPQLTTVVSLYQVGADGSEESINPFGGYAEITGSTVPVDLWTAYMQKVTDGMEVKKFPTPPWGDGAPRVKKSVSPSQSATPTPSASNPAPATPATPPPAAPAPVTPPPAAPEPEAPAGPEEPEAEPTDNSPGGPEPPVVEPTEDAPRRPEDPDPEVTQGG
ncbi:MAG: transglycosylase domain-containing protein [Buchananella hordeovulneris]|nr:transglycosylase domain-containing protein [Buchananella hordeovulneris]